MSLVPAICTQCGAQLEVDTNMKTSRCPFCGTSFIIEQAINNYLVKYNIKADVVNVSVQNDTADSMYNTCLTCCKVGEYSVMEHVLNKFQNEYPTDYRVYYIQLLRVTDCFKRFDTNIQNNQITENQANSLMSKIRKFASESEIRTINAEYNNYIAKLRKIISENQEKERCLSQEYERQSRNIAQKRMVVKGIVIALIVSFALAMDALGLSINVGVFIAYLIVIDIPCIKLIMWIIDR